ncbi:MAG: glycosyl hydrolase family 28-related protein, partial [Verrucomicrobiota bacterium]
MNCRFNSFVLLGLIALAGVASAVEFDVTAYGAIPDDGLDDTAGIQAALDAADTLAGVDSVYLPAGDYFVEMLLIGGETVF